MQSSIQRRDAAPKATSRGRRMVKFRLLQPAMPINSARPWHTKNKRMWQFDLYLHHIGMPLPIARSRNPIPSLSAALAMRAQRTLAASIGPPWQAFEDNLTFGGPDGERVDIVYESQNSASIRIRFDLRVENPQFQCMVRDLARQLGCLFFVPQTRRLVETDIESLSAALSDIRAQSHPRAPPPHWPA